MWTLMISGGIPRFDGFSPVQRVRPAPGISRLIEPVARFDEVIGRDDIVRRVRNDRAPPARAGPGLGRPHQAELQRPPPMLAQHANPAEIAGAFGVRGWDQTSEGDRVAPVKHKPPISEIESGKGCAPKECETMKVGENIRNLVILPVYGPYLIHRADLSIIYPA